MILCPNHVYNCTSNYGHGGGTYNDQHEELVKNVPHDGGQMADLPKYTQLANLMNMKYVVDG